MLTGILDEQSAHVAPMLVRLYDSHRLYSLARDKRPVARSELASVVVDLFETKLSVYAQELVTDILVGLTRQAEQDLRHALADRLAILPSVPLRMILHLANDEISVARPVLSKSPVLSDMDLVYIIKSQGPDYWRAIASRWTLSAQVADMLADLRDNGTAKVLAENAHITLSDHAIEVLAEMARESDDLARPLLARPELPARIAARLYKAVADDLKQYIVSKFDIKDVRIEEAIDDVIMELSSSGREEYRPGETMLRDAAEAAVHDRLSVSMMLDLLRRGQHQSFVACFSAYAGLPVEKALDILCQKSGQALAIACKASDIEKPDFVTLFMLTQRMRRKDKIVGQQDLTCVLAYYDRVKKNVAQRMLRNARL